MSCQQKETQTANNCVTKDKKNEQEEQQRQRLLLAPAQAQAQASWQLNSCHCDLFGQDLCAAAA